VTVTVHSIESRLAIREMTPEVAVVSLHGRVDAASVRLQRDQLHVLVDKGIRFVVVDLADVTFLDSAGMAMLVSLLKRTRAVEGDVRLVEPFDESVRHILRLTRLDLVFNLKASVDAALQHLAPGH
jgi:anti-sigma B factor antagonist